MPNLWKVVAVALVWDGVLWLVVGGLIASVLPGGWRTVLVVAILAFLPFLVLLRGLGGDAYPSAFVRIWVLRPFWYAQLALLLLALSGLAGMLAGLPFGAAGKLGRWAIAVVGVFLILGAVWGYMGTKRLVVRPLDLHFPELAPALDGIRIVQLSDLHVGPHTSVRHLSRIAEAVRNAEPYLIVLTGDQVDDFARDVEPLGRAFGGLTAPLGVIAVAGNHDVYAGWSAVRKGMERIGWTVLVNESIPIEVNGARFWVAGTGDPAGRGGPGGADPSVIPDVERTLAGVPDGEFVLALAHNPSLWPELAARGVELTLSGHTHYGQIAIPRLGWSVASLFLEHAMGMYRNGNSVLYINPGTNYWGIPLRIGTPPEVTVVKLHRDPAGAAVDGASKVKEGVAITNSSKQPDG